MLWRGGVALLACNYITGKFIGISTFFNPGRHQNKVDNFRLFRASVKAQGLQMLCVELTFGEEPFQLRPDDCDILLQRRTAAGTRCLTLTLTLTLINLTLTLTTDLNLTTDPHQAGNTLWQKERLLNIAIENLPNTVEKVMWLDSDLIFLNDDWVAETASDPSPNPNLNPNLSLTPTYPNPNPNPKPNPDPYPYPYPYLNPTSTPIPAQVPETAALLDRYPVVQPFGWMTYLPQAEGEDYAVARLPTLPLGQGVGGVYHAAGLAVSSFPDMCFHDSFLLGHPGFAWAARRDLMAKVGFYDRSIIGGGDRIMLNGFTGHGAGYFRKVPPAMVEDVRAFGKRLLPLVGPANVSYTPGVVLHIWHGDRANRDYTHRYEILKGNAYDPVRDVRVNEQGVLEWATDKPKLHREVTEYFNNRKEGPKEARNKSIAKPEEDMWASADRQRKGLASFAKVQALGRARLWLLRLLGARLAALGGSAFSRRKELTAIRRPATATGARASCFQIRRFHFRGPSRHTHIFL